MLSNTYNQSSVISTHVRHNAKVFIMKKFLGIVVLVLGFICLHQNHTIAEDYMSDEKCAELAGNANTDYAARNIIRNCRFQEKVFMSIMYEPELKCAIKSGKAKTEVAARRIYRNCNY